MSFNWVLIVFFFASLALPSATLAKTLYGRVLKVFDGDTILVRVQGQEEHVRLREIDAPEVTHRKKAGQEPWGRRARDFAKSLVEKKTVRMELEEREERDKYHRLLGYVFFDHTFVNREMISSGNAFFYPGPYKGKRAAELQAAEEVARGKGLGVWDKNKGLKERPHDFRARTQRDESLFSKFWRLIRGEEKKPPPKEYPVPAHKIVANKRSMVYHMPGSPGAARVNPKNRILFDTPEEAEKGGFRRAKTGNS
ncbi:MAG: thermonuclease family protein [Deltaproteobacteria bacterium]|nr:thermonuclease family protein [Deltaproteobacteria bacterium]